MRWTKERPTKPGFYFARTHAPNDALKGIDFWRVDVVEVVNAPPPFLRYGPVKIEPSNLDPATEFAGPIPLPEEM